MRPLSWAPYRMRRIWKHRHDILRLLRKSRREVIMVSGTLLPRVYESPAVLRALESALSRGVRFRLFTGPGAADSPFAGLIRRNPGSSLQVMSRSPLMHFTVVDAVHVRYQGIHPAGEFTPTNSMMSDAPSIAEMLLQSLGATPTAARAPEKPGGRLKSGAKVGEQQHNDTLRSPPAH